MNNRSERIIERLQIIFWERCVETEGADLREGDYSVWFRTPSGTGTALVHVKDGQIFGGDAFIEYEGRYRLDGKNFEAVINTKRHTGGPSTWFGMTRSRSAYQANPLDELPRALVPSINVPDCRSISR